MPKAWLLTTVLTLSAFAASASAQEPARPAAELLCSEISTLEEAHAAALVYYIAGFVDGQQAAAGTAPAGNPDMVGGISLSAAAVLEACAASPELPVTDAIAAQGGSTGAAPAPSAEEPAASPSETAVPADDATAPDQGDPPAEGGTTEGGTTTPPAEGGAEGGTTTPQ